MLAQHLTQGAVKTHLACLLNKSMTSFTEPFIIRQVTRFCFCFLVGYCQLASSDTSSEANLIRYFENLRQNLYTQERQE